MENQPNNLNKLCNEMSMNLVNAGKFIGKAAAIDSIDQYFANSGRGPQEEGHIYGFTYGLNSVRKLLLKIDMINANVTDPKDRIDGLRFYKGFSKRNDPDFRLEPNVQYEDIFIMPILSDGKDYYTVHRIVDEEIILSESRPCPNQCGLTFK